MLSEVMGEDGEPLSDSNGALSEASLKRRLENQQKTQIELDLTAKFEKIVGANNVQVLANPEIDIDQIRREIKDVGGEDNVTGPAVREDLDVETLQGSRPDAAGIAGTGSNVQNPQNAAIGTGVGSPQRYGRDKGTTIYSNDEIREAVKVASGSVKQYRLSVVCSDKIAESNPSSCLAVQNAAEQYVGANETVAFNTAALVQPAKTTKAAKQAENMAMILLFVKYFLLATGLGLMAFFIRRALNDRTYELLYPEDDMLELEDGLEPIPLKELEAAISAASTLDSQKRQEIQQKVDRIAAQKPNDVAQQLRGWLNDGSHR
jgi:flagellar biosynthesis/type III secretory pathway M-ring protein FliF/YscJ